MRQTEDVIGELPNVRVACRNPFRFVSRSRWSLQSLSLFKRNGFVQTALTCLEALFTGKIRAGDWTGKDVQRQLLVAQGELKPGSGVKNDRIQERQLKPLLLEQGFQSGKGRDQGLGPQ